AAVVVCIRVQANDPEHLAGAFLHRDECHGARVIDLGETRDEGVPEFLHRRKEPQTQVLWRDLSKKRHIQRLVFRPHRSDKDPRSVAQRGVSLPFRGIGPNREAWMTGWAT